MGETKVKEGEKDSSVIDTPGPPERPTPSDDAFIAPEGTPACDPEYEPSVDTEGTDGDDEDEIEGGEPSEATWRAALQAAARGSS